MLLQKISHSWLCAHEVRDCFACRRPPQFRLYLTAMEFSNFYNKPFQRFASKMMLFLVMVTLNSLAIIQSITKSTIKIP